MEKEAPLVLRVCRVSLDHLAFLDLQVSRVQEVCQDLRECRATQDLLVDLESLAHQV